MATVAGNGSAGFSGDGGAAGLAQLHLPYGLAIDTAANLYIADLGNRRVRRVSPAGIISTFAGTGESGSSGDGGAAIAAQLTAPRNVAVDSAGNVYISEFEGHRIRRVSASGIITTVAGTGSAGYSGDGGPANKAQLAFPAGLATDRAGSVYVADSKNGVVRMITAGGVISTVYGAPDGPQPIGISLDQSGMLYVADTSTVVKRVLLAGAISFPLAGSYSAAHDLAVDASGTVYLVDGNALRRISASGVVGVIASSALVPLSSDSSNGRAAALSHPAGLALDSVGNLYIADSGTHRVRQITAQGVIATLAGTGSAGYSGDDGPAAQSQLNAPRGLALTPNGSLLVADTGNQRIRRIDFSGNIRTIAGAGISGALLSAPEAVAVDASGNVYIADSENNRVLRIAPAGLTAVVAGDGTAGYAGDGGQALLARLNQPSGLALAPSGEIYIADTGNHRIRKIAPSGLISTVAGSGAQGFSGDGGSATSAQLNAPEACAVDANGNLYITDTGNNRVRMVDTKGVISTIAGTGESGYGGDGGAATSAKLQSPAGLIASPTGVIFVADTGNSRIRRLTPTSVPPPIEQVGDASVVNAASMQPGPVAPGELVSIFGSGMGPADALQGKFNSAGMMDTTLGSVEVLFDGEAAPLFYVQANQINAQVPYSVAGRAETKLEIRYQGQARARATLPVTSSAPGVFAVMVNEDGTINSESNAAARGSVITFYATGEGVTSPAGAAGKAAQPPLAAPVLPVQLTIGGNPAEILYAASAPGFAGLMQINARVPAGFVPTGKLAVTLTVGNTSSQTGVLLNVR